jgi:acyl-coenzyme A synthetase/AMP-(fatty) acid ligase
MFDGNPGAPDLGELWRLAGGTGMTYFGTSAPFLLACRKAEIVPKRLATCRHDRSRLDRRAASSRGFRWVYEAVNENAQLQSISGGTDVCTAIRRRLTIAAGDGRARSRAGAWVRRSRRSTQLGTRSSVRWVSW